MNKVNLIRDLSVELEGIMRTALRDLWRKEDKDFLFQLAKDVAREKIMAEIGDNPEKHKRNLYHLMATLKGEVVRKGLKIKPFKKDSFVEILNTLIKTVAVPLLKVTG